MSTRRMKKDLESAKEDFKPLKDEPRAGKRKLEEDVDMSDLIDDPLGSMPLSRLSPTLTKVAKVQLLKIQTDYPLI